MNDACGVCDGDGTSCSVVVKSIPRAIASCDASVLVVGAGFHNGDNVNCSLHHSERGEVVNTVGK